MNEGPQAATTEPMSHNEDPEQPKISFFFKNEQGPI